MTERILYVDDEVNMLASFQRMLRGRFDLETAASGRDGLQMIAAGGPFAVVVADMRMPGMDGVEFLAEVKELTPDTVRLMLTGNADLDTAIRAVNEGSIFRFLTKPCSQDLLVKSVEAGLRLYRLVTAERDLLEQTLNGSIKVLTDVLSLANPLAFGRAGRLKRYVGHIVAQLGLPDAWRFEVAAMLCQIGLVTLPAETMAKISAGRKLAPHEEKMLASHPGVGSKLISNIPRLESVAGMIAKQREPFGPGDSAGVKDRDEAALGGQILKAAMEFDERVERGIPPRAAIAQMRQRPEEYDPGIAAALEGVEVRRPQRERIPVDDHRHRERSAQAVRMAKIGDNTGL